MTKNDFTTEELQKLFGEKQQEHMEKCAREVNEVLIKYRCRIQPVTVIRDGRITTTINIVSR